MKSGGGGGHSNLTARLAGQIVERINALEMPVGSHLAEQTLANNLRVSRTPVRLALQFLSTMGVVEKRNNRGFFSKKSGDALQSVPGMLADDGEDALYFQIGEDRLARKLASHVTEAELIRRYRVKRSRLQLLLSRMESEGWVSRHPGRGWEFRPVLDSIQAYSHAYRFRMLIEPGALREPNYRMEKAICDRLRAQQQEMLDGGALRYSRFKLFQIGANFHEELVNGSGNAFFLDGIRRVNRLRRLMEYHVHKDRTSVIHECKDHLTLLDLIEGKKYEKAAVFLHRHLVHALKKKLDIAGSLSRRGSRIKRKTKRLRSAAKEKRSQ